MTAGDPRIEAALAGLVEQIEAWTGIELHRGGRRASLKRFVEARMRALNLRSADAYTAMLTGPEDPEVERIVSVVTVGHTWFFRDAGQMQAISMLLAEGFTGAQAARRPVEVWVPGCSTGEDAYTIALLGMRARRDVAVLGTDINSQALDRARAGRFGSWSVRELPSELRGGVMPLDVEIFAVSDALRSRVRFERQNLLDAPREAPSGGGWDLIVCRNVLIYFSPSTASITLARLSAALAPGGWLLVGASEVVHSAPLGAQLRTLGGRFGLQRDSAATSTRVLETGAATALGLRPHDGAPTSLPPSRGNDCAPQRVREADPENSGPVVDALARANASLVAGDAGRAVTLYGAVLELDPLCAEARMFAGIAHHLRSDPAAAVDELRAALFLDPDLWPAAFYLALNYEKLGLARDAQREYQRVVSMSGRIPSLRSRSSVLGDIAAWKEEVVAVSKRRAARVSEPAEAG